MSSEKFYTVMVAVEVCADSLEEANTTVATFLETNPLEEISSLAQVLTDYETNSSNQRVFYINQDQ